MDTNNCVLKLNHLIFDKVSFQRDGFRNENPVNFTFGFRFDIEEEYIVACICVTGKKEDEYRFEVQASGHFMLSGEIERADIFAKQNAAAIIFPYIRSQITLLTSQPETEPVILPPVNIARMVQEAEKSEVSENAVKDNL